MGWRSRLNQGMIKMGLATPIQPPQNHFSSVNLNSLKSQMSIPNNGMDFAEAVPGFSQPVWGPEISTVGAYSREGYTSIPFDKPVIPFQTQVVALQTDEDVTLAINHLSSQITGGEHYWKGANDEMSNYIEEFSKAIDFDEIDTMLVKELLWYGNSVWKAREGVANIRDRDDLMHIPISSFARIWWDRQRIPYKYEFRGAQYQGYHNPDEIIHLKWNPVNASAFGIGFGVPMTSPHVFEQITANGMEPNRLPSLLDRKYSNQMTMHIAERRYTPRNVYIAKDADDNERATLQSQIQDLRLGEDLVAGSSLEIQELGSSARAFNPTQFTDTVLGPIMKAMNDFRGKQGTESSHQFANAKTSAILDQIGLSSFPLTVTRMLIDQLFKPWYDANPLYDPSYGGGYVAVPWETCDYDLNFGRIEKQDVDTKDSIELIKMAWETGAIQDPNEMRELLEDAGLGLRKEFSDAMSAQYDPSQMPPDFGQQVLPQFDDMGGGEIPNNFANQYMGSPPMDNPIYDSMSIDIRGPGVAQPTDPRLNFTETQRRLNDPKKTPRFRRD
jgi:hypothetical protein